MSESKKKKAQKPKSITITLSEPIAWGDDKISEIVLCRPKGKHLSGLSTQPTLKDLIGIAQKCSEHPMAVFNDMDADDYMAVCEAVGDFLDSGQEIGKSRQY